MKPCPVRPKPAPGNGRILPQEFGHQRMKARPVIHVHAMCHFMRNGGAPNGRRGKDQPPAIADVARRRTTAPARDRIPNPDPAERNAEPCGKIATFFLKDGASFTPQPAQNPCLERSARPADA